MSAADSLARLRVPRGLGRFLGLVLVTLVATAAGVWQVHARYETVRLGYAIDESRFEARRLLERTKRLELSLATWKDPERVRRLASDRLGMRVAAPSDELVIPSGETAPSARIDAPAPAASTATTAPAAPPAPGEGGAP